MINCTGTMKIGYLSKAKQTNGKTSISGIIYSKDQRNTLNLAFTCFDPGASILESYGEKGMEITFSVAKLINEINYNPNASDEDNNKRRLLIFTLDKIRQFDESIQEMVIVWENEPAEQEYEKPNKKQKQNKKENNGLGFELDEDDLPF